MKKLRALLLAFPLLFTAAWAALLVEVFMRQGGALMPLHFRITAVQAAVWLAMLPPAFLLLDRLLRRPRSAVTEALSIAALCIACAFAGQVAFGQIAWAKRWYYATDRYYFVFDESLPTALRLATRRLEAPLLLAAAGLLAGRFLFAYGRSGSGRCGSEDWRRDCRKRDSVSCARSSIRTSCSMP